MSRPTIVHFLKQSNLSSMLANQQAKFQLISKISFFFLIQKGLINNKFSQGRHFSDNWDVKGLVTV